MKIIFGLSVIMVLILAGCAGIQNNMQSSEPKEVKFGWIGPLTGGASVIGTPIKDSVALAVDEVNAIKLLKDKTLRVIYEDDECDPKKSVTAVQKLISIDNVIAIHGGVCSGTTLADAPLAEQNKVLLMSPGSSNPKIKDAGDYIFRVVPPDQLQGAAGADLMKNANIKKVAVLQILNDYGEGLAGAFIAQAQKIGIEVVAHEKFSVDSTDLRTQLTKITALAPEGVYLIAHPAETALALKQAKEAGLTALFVGGDASKDGSVISGAGSAAEGFIITTFGVPESKELDAFAAKWKTRYNKEWQPYTPEAYDVLMILAKACAATDCTSPSMKDYLYKMGPYKGASGMFEFDSNGEVQKPYDYFQVKEGKWVKAFIIDDGGLRG